MLDRPYKNLLLNYEDDGILTITINRPERHNAADEEMHGELCRVWLDVAEDPRCRVAVVTGAGDFFCAGGELDMAARTAGNYEHVAEMVKEASDLVYNMINCDKPIISAINGPAAGTGTAIALLADISIMANEAKLTDGHMRLGVAAGDHAAMLWPLLCGMAKAKYYLLTADTIDGREAERIGLVSRAVPRGEVMDVALEIAHRLGSGPQHALRWTKRSLNNWLRLAGPTFDASLALELLSFLGDDVAEGVRSFQEKRPPDFPSAR